MNDATFHAMRSQMGRAGGIAAGVSRRVNKKLVLRAIARQWPSCPMCGQSTHMGFCSRCDRSVATM